MSSYWSIRYLLGGNSGAGSYGEAGQWKVDWLKKHSRGSVVDLGCGDGTIAARVCPSKYQGWDPSWIARERTRWQGMKVVRRAKNLQPAQYAWSLDVIYHLRDKEYFKHIEQLFNLAPTVIIYAPREPFSDAPHIYHREWLLDIPVEPTLVERNPYQMNVAFWVFSV